MGLRDRKKRKSDKLGVFIKPLYLRDAPKIVNMGEKNRLNNQYETASSVFECFIPVLPKFSFRTHSVGAGM